MIQQSILRTTRAVSAGSVYYGVDGAVILALTFAAWLTCFGVALGARFGLFAAIGGGMCGAIAGLFSGFALNFGFERLYRWLDELADKRRVLGMIVRVTVFVVVAALLGAFFALSSRVVFQSLKESIRKQRPSKATAPNAAMTPRFQIEHDWRGIGESRR